MALWIGTRLWLHFPQQLCCRPNFFSLKRTFPLPPSFVIWQKEDFFPFIYIRIWTHEPSTPVHTYVCLFFKYVAESKPSLAQGSSLCIILKSFMKIISQVEGKVLMNSCIVEKGKLWGQLLLYIRESTQALDLKTEIYRKPSSLEKWSNRNNKIK